MEVTNFSDAFSAPQTGLPESPDAHLPQLPPDLPVMQSWWVLLQPWSQPEKSKGGILMTNGTAEAIKYNQYIMKVVAIGPYAFKDKRLASDVVPEVGDWVMVNRMQGQEFEYQLNDDDPVVRLRICADDAIMTVVPSPQGWRVGGVN